jgi:virulence factor BrkB
VALDGVPVRSGQEVGDDHAGDPAALLLALGLAVLVTGFLSGLGGAGPASIPLRIGALAGSALINIAMFVLAFRLATAREVATRDLVPGAVVSALLWQLCWPSAACSSCTRFRHAQSLYGAFGVVFGLLGWLHMQAQITLYAVEAEIVRARRLWPRSAVQPPLTPGTNAPTPPTSGVSSAGPTMNSRSTCASDIRSGHPANHRANEQRVGSYAVTIVRAHNQRGS